MLITTHQAIKDFIGSKESKDDALLANLATAVSQMFEKEMRRKIETKGRVQFFDVEEGQKIFRLDAYPVTWCSVYNSESREFDEEIPRKSYTYLGRLGELVIDKYSLVPGEKVLKVEYLGGMAADTAEFKERYPDIEMAARTQAAFWYEKRSRLGIASESVAQSTTHFLKLELMPIVKQVLQPYARKCYV
jgi:hypothetical protein